MEIKSLIIGIIFTFGIFAIKSGIGLYYVLTENFKNKKFIFISTIFSYFSLFFLIFFIIKYLNILEFFGAFEKFLKAGMLFHFILAIGMIWWGIHILGENDNKTKAYFMLIFPCPFCFIVIFLSASFLYKYFSVCNYKITFLFFAFFIALQAITLLILHFIRNYLNVKKVKDILGFSLVFIGCYFILTFCFAPVFSDIERIYRISSYTNTGFAFDKKSFIFFAVASFIVLAGFFKKKFIRKVNL